MPPKSFGKYQVIRPLGHGGMATVYEARDPDLERRVAIKVIHAFLALDVNLGERFRREARLVASLRHPHIVQLYDFGVAEDQPYMVMEYLDGGTLRDKLGEPRESRKGWDPVQALTALQDLASALDYAHARGAVHRDIKPGNILFTSAGDVVLTDFGIAKLLNDLTQLSQTGGLIGTPVYMSPEQASGKPVDHRSDIYSLGIVVYEMLVGRPPFEGDSPTTLLLKQVTEMPPPLASFRADLAPELEIVMRRALAKDPNQRYASTGEFALAFGEAISAAPPPQLGRPDALDAATLIEIPQGDAATLPAAASPGAKSGPWQAARPTTAAPAASPAPATRPAPEGADALEAQASAAEAAATKAVAPGAAGMAATAAVAAPPATGAAGVEDASPALEAQPAAGARPSGARRTLPRRWLALAALLVVVAAAATLAALALLRPGSTAAGGSSLRVDFRDSRSRGRLDQVALAGTGLAPPQQSQEYIAWLTGGGDARVRELGPVQLADGGSLSFTYTDPEGKNLLADFDGIEITSEQAGQGQHQFPSDQIVLRGSLPSGAVEHVRHLLVPGTDGPDGGAYARGLVSQAQVLARLGQLLQSASDGNDLRGMANVAEGIVNLIAGPGGPGFGDANGDGFTNDRSDGRGLLAAGDRPGYSDAVINHARLAAEMPDAGESIKLHSGHVQVSAGNVHDWATQLESLALDIAHAKDAAAVKGKAGEAVALCNRILNGQDTNGNEIVEPIPGEGGALTAYEHSLLMAEIPLSAPK